MARRNNISAFSLPWRKVDNPKANSLYVLDFDGNTGVQLARALYKFGPLAELEPEDFEDVDPEDYPQGIVQDKEGFLLDYEDMFKYVHLRVSVGSFPYDDENPNGRGYLLNWEGNISAGESSRETRTKKGQSIIPAIGHGVLLRKKPTEQMIKQFGTVCLLQSLLAVINES